MSEHDAIAATERPLTRADLVVALRSAAVEPGDTIIVHSSLSRLGWVVGNAHAVVAALVDVVGPDGTIVMPAQTGVSDPATWENPPVPESWWPTIREHWPPFDPALTPLRAMGAVVECLRRMPGVAHSGHPAVAFIAHGPGAAAITATHPLTDALNDDSPLGRLYDADARIVLMGVDHANNTSLHLAEHRADWPSKKSVPHGAPLLIDGTAQWVTYDDLDRDDEDFPTIGAAFVESGGEEIVVPIGCGTIRSMRMRDIVDFATDWMNQNR